MKRLIIFAKLLYLHWELGRLRAKHAYYTRHQDLDRHPESVELN